MNLIKMLNGVSNWHKWNNGGFEAFTIFNEQKMQSHHPCFEITFNSALNAFLGKDKLQKFLAQIGQELQIGYR